MNGEERKTGHGRMTPSPVFEETLRADAGRVFGPDGAWLLLSTVWYGWRSYYDLALATYTGQHPSADRRPNGYEDDFQVVLDLQIQAFLFSAAEQLATLVCAARAHGASDFFTEYVKNVPVGKRLTAISDITMDELGELVGVPMGLDDVPQIEVAESRPATGPADVPVTNVGGLLVPDSALRAMQREEFLRQAQAHAEGLMTSIQQLQQLVDRPAGHPGTPEPQPLREVDNAFRHGHRLFFYDAVPGERAFGFLGDPEALEHPSVDLYMPKGKGTSINWATVGCSPERTATTLESLRNVALCVRLFSLGFLGKQTDRGSDLWIAATTTDLPRPPAP